MAPEPWNITRHIMGKFPSQYGVGSGFADEIVTSGT